MSATSIVWQFQRIDADLYRLSASTPPVVQPGTWVYFLVQAPTPNLKAQYDTTEVWSLDSLQGWYLLTGAEITEPGVFAKVARESSAFSLEYSSTQNPRGIAFVLDPDQWATDGIGPVNTAKSALLQNTSPPLRRVTGALNVTWPGQTGIRVPQGVRCSLIPDDDGPGLRVSSDTHGTPTVHSFEFPQLSAFPPRDATTWVTDLLFAGPQCGAFVTTMAFDPGTLYQVFGGGFRYGYAAAGSASKVDFPWFPWVPAITSRDVAIQCHVFAHPLLPFEQDHTRFVLDLVGVGPYVDNARKLEAPFLQLRNGDPIALQPSRAHAPPAPKQGPPHSFDPHACGFAFVKGPGSGTVKMTASLAPVGAYSADVAAAGERACVMPGLSGMEYIRTGSPLTVVLRTGQAADATGFGADGASNPGQLLSDRYVTSGCQMSTSQSDSLDGYYAQPDASIFYGKGSGDFHVAVSAQVSMLSPATTFPIAPLLGLFPPGVGPNPHLPVSVLQSFVEQVVTPARYQSIIDHDRLTATSRDDSAPVLPRFITTGSTGAVSGTAMSPQGLLVDLDDNGNWAKVCLARGPVDPTQMLEFSGTPGQPLDTEIVNVLLKSQLVWVVSKLELLKGFDTTLTVGDFDFQPGATDPGAPQPVLIFKFSTSMTLTEIIESPASWTDSDTWIGGADDDEGPIDRVQETLMKTLSDAELTLGKAIDPFAHFRNTIANDPTWTGILSINTAIDPLSMPVDLQMLYAGISGPLTAHHFGVESSQIGVPNGHVASGPSTPPEQEIIKSSLFGVIHYVGSSQGSDASPTQEPSPSPYSFEVCELTVVFANSIVADFHSEIAMRMDELFGRAVTMAGHPSPPDDGTPQLVPSQRGAAPNTIRISGTYQRHGAVGAVTFETRAPFVFTVDTHDGQLSRVLESISIDDASLTPVTNDPTLQPPSADGKVTDAETREIRARFGIAGTMKFAARPFPLETDPNPVDIFGYGTQSGGLDFTGLSLLISFELSSQGKRRGDTCIIFDGSGLIPSASPEATRPTALVRGLPLTLAGFKAPSADADPADDRESGACAQPTGRFTADQLGAQTVNLPQVASNSIKSPMYALVYELPLGSLGSLAEAGATISASLVVGWGPVPAVNDNDGVSVMIQLPQATAGVAGFSLQGILKVVFGAANLMRVPYPDPTSTTGVWVVMFNNVQLSLLGIKFPPGVITNFVLFSDPAEPTGSNIAWYLAVAQKGEKDGGSETSLARPAAVALGPRATGVIDAPSREVFP